MLGGACQNCSTISLPAGGESRVEPQGYPNNCYSHLMTCVLARYHLEAEWGKSGPAPALLSITHSTVSTSQPSILDSGDNNYLFKAGEEHFSLFSILQNMRRAAGRDDQIWSFTNCLWHQHFATTLSTILTGDIGKGKTWL